MTPWVAPLAVWAAAAAVMTAGWEWQRRRRNAGIVDVLWAACLGSTALALALAGAGAPANRVLLALIGGGWGARLARHLWRRVRGEAEDGRYRHLRALWGDDPRRWFGFFQLQAFVVALFSLPFVAVAANPAAQPRWLAAGAAIGLLALLGEARADAELAAFRADPRHRGLTCRRGLWRYSRHPNYFFEWLHWFAYVALAIGSPLSALAWLGPVVMLLFLRYLSGIPWTEAQALRTRGDYADYQRRTSMLIPWLPKSVRDEKE